jgi:plastocyanin
MTLRARAAAVLLSVLLVTSFAPLSASAVRLDGRSRALVTVLRVKMIDNAYRPRSVSIARGTRVRWVNRGLVSHTATSDTGIWDSGLIQPGDRWARTFRKAGTFKYHCTIHGTMTGTITVT